MEIDGKKVQNVYAVTVPLSLRSAAQQHLFERMASATLVWQEWRSDGTSGPRNSGTATELANAVARTTPPAGDLEEAVDVLDKGARRAGSLLYTSPGTVGRVAKVFSVDPSDEVANMAALVVINAMVFQERLASGAVVFQPVSAAMRAGRFSRIELLRMWDEILRIDYYPIFSMARNVVGSCPTLKLRLCWTSAPGQPPPCWVWERWGVTTWPDRRSTSSLRRESCLLPSTPASPPQLFLQAGPLPGPVGQC